MRSGRPWISGWPEGRDPDMGPGGCWLTAMMRLSVNVSTNRHSHEKALEMIQAGECGQFNPLFEGICQSGGYFKTAGRRSDPIRQFEIRGIYQSGRLLHPLLLKAVTCARRFAIDMLLSGAGGTMADKEICMR